jgi:glutaredoxin
LERLGVPYDYVDIESDAAASEWVKRENNGKEQKPTVKIGDQVLLLPTTRELRDALKNVAVPTKSQF